MKSMKPILVMVAHQTDTAFWKLDFCLGSSKYCVERIFDEEKLNAFLQEQTFKCFSIFMWVVSAHFSSSPSDSITEIRKISDSPVIAFVENNSLALEKALRAAGASICLANSSELSELPLIVSHCLALFARNRLRCLP